MQYLLVQCQLVPLEMISYKFYCWTNSVIICLKMSFWQFPTDCILFEKTSVLTIHQVLTQGVKSANCENEMIYFSQQQITWMTWRLKIFCTRERLRDFQLYFHINATQCIAMFGKSHAWSLRIVKLLPLVWWNHYYQSYS